ncbi:MAG: ABC transporter ATP-binding protein [Bacteroidia bacterium]|nr:ABC transporter ATP-binding protein [Bacteroidia bacterium]
MSSKYALEVKNVSKSFRLPTEQASGIKQAVINRARGIKGYKEQHVLKDISFKVEKGDFFGIVGRNGSGKSTLLKLISQIYTPDSGSIKVNGTLVPFIELGVGFNPELTGRENVYMNGALLGFSREEVSKMYPEIVEFAELEEFMDQKLKNYSSGMQVRLAFSIAIKAQGDILVLDEVLAVGDESFQRKCFNYFAQLKREKKTVILVTHSMEQVQQFCNKAALIDKGHKLEVGNPLEISNIYRGMNSDKLNNFTHDSNNKNISITPKFSRTNELLSFCFDINSKIELDKDTIITFVINRSSGELVLRWTSDEETTGLNLNGNIKIHFDIQNIFPIGQFNVQVAIKSKDRTREYAVFDNIINFEEIYKGKTGNNAYWKPNIKFKIQ